MRALFLTEYYPFDLRTDVFGVFKRMRMLMDAVMTFADVDVLFFSTLGVDESPAAIRQLEINLTEQWGLHLNVFLRHQKVRSRKALWKRLPFCIRCASLGAVAYHSHLSLDTSHEPSVRAVDRCLDRRPDFILAYRLGTMAPLLRTTRSLPPVFFDLDDVEHVKAMRIGRHATSVRQRMTAYGSVPILLWAERRAMALARSTFVTSGRDLARFRRFPRHQHRVIVPNAVAIPPFVPLSVEPTLLYLGNYVYRPNIEAADFLVREVWPRVHARQPDARLLIAGSYPERIPSLRPAPGGVEVLGFVDDLAALYRKTRVACCPIRVAGGTRIKILEAAAHGRPVVATSVGAEGLDLADGQEILLRDDPQSFADACVNLLVNSAVAARLGAAARARVARLYDRERTITHVRDIITAALDRQ